MSGSKICLAIIAIIILLALVQFLYDPISSVQHTLEISQIHDQFTKAQAQWDTAALQDYSFEIRGNSQSICAVDAVIEVRNSTVITVKPLQSASPLLPEKWADPDWGNEVFLCDYNHFAVPRMFEMLGKTLQNSPFAILAAEFDPHYGFITRFEDGIFASNGLVNLRAKNVYNEFQIVNFKPD